MTSELGLDGLSVSKIGAYDIWRSSLTEQDDGPWQRDCVRHGAGLGAVVSKIAAEVAPAPELHSQATRSLRATDAHPLRTRIVLLAGSRGH
jgi:hypothetical protein